MTTVLTGAVADALAGVLAGALAGALAVTVLPVALAGAADLAAGFLGGAFFTGASSSGRGGAYSTNPALAALDHQESYLRTLFGFLGISDVRFVRAEGVAMGEAAKTQALNAADEVIRAVSASAVADDKTAAAA